MSEQPQAKSLYERLGGVVNDGLIFANIEREVGIRPHNVEITIYETPKHNWGIRGLCGDELVLGYKVDV